MNFKAKIWAHLADYKRKTLGINVSGTFKGREYEHILPIQLKMKNLLPFCKNDVDEIALAKTSLHKCFHHLNSSQAMCLNFFVPIIDSSLLNVILPDELSSAGYKTIPETAAFEMPSQLDNVKNEIPTTFDFCVKAAGPAERIINLSVEVKYTEDAFGSAKNDNRHVEKINDLYLPLASTRGAIASEWLDGEKFTNNYQIMRNLLHIDQDSYVIFIYPARNIAVAKDAENARDSILNERFKQHLILKTWEEIVEKLPTFPDFFKFQTHYSEFVAKYLPWMSNEHDSRFSF